MKDTSTPRFVAADIRAKVLRWITSSSSLSFVASLSCSAAKFAVPASVFPMSGVENNSSNVCLALQLKQNAKLAILTASARMAPTL